jgi:hypothetical protein
MTIAPPLLGHPGIALISLQSGGTEVRAEAGYRAEQSEAGTNQIGRGRSPATPEIPAEHGEENDGRS